MNTTIGRLGAMAAASMMVVGLSALPAGAGDISANIEVSGEATCDTATGTWAIEWTVSNEEMLPVSEPDSSRPAGLISYLTAEIDAAVMSGAATGSVADLVGQSVAPEAFVAATVTGIPNASGDVTLTVDYTWDSGEAEATSRGEVTLDGSCTATTTTPGPTTTAATAAAAVAARPAFTG